MFVLCMCEFISNSKTLCTRTHIVSQAGGGGGGEETGPELLPNNCQPIFMGDQPAYSPWLSSRTIVTAVSVRS